MYEGVVIHQTDDELRERAMDFRELFAQEFETKEEAIAAVTERLNMARSESEEGFLGGLVHSATESYLIEETTDGFMVAPEGAI